MGLFCHLSHRQRNTNVIDISLLSAEQLDRFIHLQSIIARQQEEAAKVKAARDYYAGNHPVMLTQRQQEYLGKQLTDGEFAFAHNLVKTVVDTLRERLAVTGFTVNGKSADDLDAKNPAPDAQLAALLWQWWKHNRMDSQQIRLYRRTLRDGKSYVMVDYDNANQRPRLSLHEVDDGTTGIVLHRNPEDENQVLFASRYFYTFNPLKPGLTGIERKTVYLPGEIRSGAAPADVATADSGTVLATLTLPSDWMAAASGGTKAKSGTWQDASADATGTAGHFRIYASDGTTAHLQGTVTATGGGGDLTLDNVSIASGQSVTITSFTLTEANA